MASEDPPRTGLVMHSGAPALTREEPCLISVEERVSHIRELMEADNWRSLCSRELAGIWGISEASVRRHAAEASRQIRSVMDAGAQAVRVEALLDEAATTARRRQKKDPIGTAGALIKVALLRAKLGGLITSPRKPRENDGEGDEDEREDDDFASTTSATAKGEVP